MLLFFLSLLLYMGVVLSVLLLAIVAHGGLCYCFLVSRHCHIWFLSVSCSPLLYMGVYVIVFVAHNWCICGFCVIGFVAHHCCTWGFVLLFFGFSPLSYMFFLSILLLTIVVDGGYCFCCS